MDQINLGLEKSESYGKDIYSFSPKRLSSFTSINDRKASDGSQFDISNSRAISQLKDENKKLTK